MIKKKKRILKTINRGCFIVKVLSNIKKQTIYWSLNLKIKQYHSQLFYDYIIILIFLMKI